MPQEDEMDVPGSRPAVKTDVRAAIEQQVRIFAAQVRAERLPVDPRDVVQASWVCCLERADTYDPQHPGSSGFFLTVIRRGVRPQIARWLSPLALTGSAPRASAAVEVVSPELVIDDLTPEAVAMVRQATTRRAGAEAAALEALPPRQRAAVEIMRQGLRYGARARAARALGVSPLVVAAAARAHARALARELGGAS